MVALERHWVGVPYGVIDLDVETIDRHRQIEPNGPVTSKVDGDWRDSSGMPAAASASAKSNSASLPTGGRSPARRSTTVPNTAAPGRPCPTSRSATSASDHGVQSRRLRASSITDIITVGSRSAAMSNNVRAGDVTRSPFAYMTTSCSSRRFVRCTRTPASRASRGSAITTSSTSRGVRRSFQCAAAVISETTTPGVDRHAASARFANDHGRGSSA
jgi:hypothetical protein